MDTTTLTRTRYIGNCQLCEADQKLHQGRMVHHGYQRPGDGYIVGDCPGVHQEPYEVSCEAIKSYKVSLEQKLVSTEKSLARHQNNEITAMTVTRVQDHRIGHRNLIVEEYQVCVTSPYLWNNEMRDRIYEHERDISALKREIDRCTRRIAAWKPLPIRTIEEEQAKERAAKAVRAAEVAAKRAAKQAKIAATRAKQAVLKAKRDAIIAAFAQRFLALATQPITEEVKVQAWALVEETRKPKNRFFYLNEMNIPDAMITLGLAERTETAHGWVRYLA